MITSTLPATSDPVPSTRPALACAARVRGLTRTYGTGPARVDALAGVDLDLPVGQFTAVMGPSGSGKSTLMHCAAGLDRPTTGQAWIGSTEITALRERALTRLRRERVGFVFQAFNLVPTLTAAENILLPLSIARHRPDMDWYAHIVDALGLGDRLGHRPAELSGGQQQRVACARALVARPDIIFADEPTGNLDTTASGEVLGFLRAAVDDYGQTVVMVTHDATAAAYADRAVFLTDGRIVHDLAAPTRDTVLATMATLTPMSAPSPEAAPSPVAAAGAPSRTYQES